LRANTSFHTNCLNNFLTENAPSNRVLSGEVIIFQNETHDIFKDLINASECPITAEPDSEVLNGRRPLTVRYVNTILLEFLRCVLENSIPLQPAQ